MQKFYMCDFVSGTHSASNCKSNWDETHCEENDHLLHRNILIMAFRELCANLVQCSNRHEDNDGYFTSSFSKMLFSCLDLF